MTKNSAPQSKLKILFTLLIGLAPYWFMNATVWIPWVFLSKALGITIMVLFVPLLWGYATYYCFKHTPKQDWKKERWNISILFFLSSAISDVFFFLIWRHLTIKELYHPTTIASYFLVLIIPFIVEKLAESLYSKGKFKIYTAYNWKGIIAFVIVFILITLYSVRYW